MNDDVQLCNHSSHCEMCSPGVRNYVRVHVGDPMSEQVRIAVCAVHDIAGPVDLLPEIMRLVTEGRRLA